MKRLFERQPGGLIPRPQASEGGERGSVLIIVLWIAFGLVAVTLYFANSMTFELRAADNRASGLSADQAIEGAARYASYILSNLSTNGTVPDFLAYQREAVPIGDAHFWFIGRDNESAIQPSQPFFGLVDEGSKLNLNTVSASQLELLPMANMTPDFAGAIVDWRDTDDTVSDNGGAESQAYSALHPPYYCKNTNFESVDELRLVYGATMDLLVGEDLNRNGVLDPNELDANHNGVLDAGILDYVTVYSREPNTGRTNVNNRPQLEALLRGALGDQREREIITRMGPATTQFKSPLEFYLRSKMKPEEFELIASNITVSTGTYIKGRVNINTASAMVLSCLPGITSDIALQLITYRQSNPDQLGSIGWIIDALGQGNDATLQLLQTGDFITTQSFQYTADIAAIGPFGRGYRRVRFVFDLSSGTPQIVYRQDLSHLGWALGKDARDAWLTATGKPNTLLP